MDPKLFWGLTRIVWWMGLCGLMMVACQIVSCCLLFFPFFFFLVMNTVLTHNFA